MNVAKQLVNGRWFSTRQDPILSREKGSGKRGLGWVTGERRERGEEGEGVEGGEVGSSV